MLILFLVFGCSSDHSSDHDNTPPNIISATLINNSLPEVSASTESFWVGNQLGFQLHGEDADGDACKLITTMAYFENDNWISLDPVAVDLELEDPVDFTYAHDDFYTITTPSGEWRISFQLEDAKGNKSEIVEMVFSVAENSPPVSSFERVSTNYGQAITVDLSDCISDPDGDALTITEVTIENIGLGVNNGDGTITVIPVEGFIGRIICYYMVSDGKGGMVRGQLLVDVETPEKDAYIKIFDFNNTEMNYIASLTLPEASDEGFWSMNIDNSWAATDTVTLSMSGVLKENGETPVFLAFSASEPVTVDVTVFDTNLNIGGLNMEVLQQSPTGERENIYGPVAVVSGGSYSVSIPEEGFYIINVFSSEDSERGVCRIDLTGSSLVNGFIAGGWIDHREESGLFCYAVLMRASDRYSWGSCNISVLFGENYGEWGAESPELKVYMDNSGELTQYWPDPIDYIVSPGRTTRISLNADGSESEGSSIYSGIVWPCVSEDGRYVVFSSEASDLVDNDLNDSSDIFLYDQDTGQIERISENASGEEGDEDSEKPQISADGQYVAYQSFAKNLIEYDGNRTTHVFLYSVKTGETTLVSADESGNAGDDMSYMPAISGSGHFVAYKSYANNLVDGKTAGVFMYDWETKKTSYLTGGYSVDNISIGGNGSYVAYVTREDVVSDDTNNFYQDIYVYDRNTGENRLVSADSSGIVGIYGGDSPAISEDGRYVVFESSSTNLIDNDTNHVSDIFLHDLTTGETIRVSVGSSGEELLSGSRRPSISADGRYISFVYQSVDGSQQIFVKDRTTGELKLVTVNIYGKISENESLYSWIYQSISGSGEFIVFSSAAGDLVQNDTNGREDVFIHSLVDD